MAKALVERCEVCGAQAVGIYVDLIDCSAPGDTWHKFKAGERHVYCSVHKPKPEGKPESKVPA